MHQCTYRVYYEDTDAGGVVYYANYLKFAERARTEMVREWGVNQSQEAFLFVVRKAELDLKKPARLDDELRIETRVDHVGGASLEIIQHIYSEQILLACAAVTIVSVSPEFKPMRLPQHIRALALAATA